MIGTTLQSRYRIDSQLGQGGMGTVYAGHDLRLNRPVAIKVLKAASDEGRERLMREARAAAALQHPHIVTVHDVGEANGAPFVVMERIAGLSLRHAERPSFSQVVEVVRQVCDALQHAHAHGIVHRDVKPENVLVSIDGERWSAKLADLGIAWSGQDTRVTHEGAVVGSPSYLAPEQVLGVAPDGRADLYSLGVMLYELVTGRLPFVGDDPLTVLSQHLHAPVVPPRTYRADLSPALEGVILRLLAKQPEDRFASAQDASLALAEAAASTAGAEPAAAETPDRVRLLDQLARGRLISRRDEMDELRQLWTRAMRGQSHLVLISGEPGVGKTRVARELMVLARLGGATVLQGGCYEFEATTPYLPFVEALRNWVRAQDTETLRATLGATANELTRLAPEIDARIGPLPPSPALSSQEERLRLFDHVTRFLQGLAADRGLLLFLDDLHWADHGTLALLHYILRNLRGDRLLVLGAYREIELDRAHPLSAALVDWNRERLATRIPLGRFSLDETNRMLAALFGQDEVASDFAKAMHHETEGNPFFLEEVVKSLIEQGQIDHHDGEWHRLEVGELTIPQSVKAAIGRRLDRLSPECVEVLHTAAALGKKFEFNELVAIAPSGEDRVLDALDEAAAAQLVRVEREDSYIFTHDKIREVLHEELNPIRKRRLHQRIGETLEKLYPSSLDAHVQDLAYHFAESSDLRKGLEYSRSAASAAEGVHAHEEALGFLERARECADALEQPDQIAEIEASIGRVQLSRGEFTESVVHYERALALTSSPTKRAAIQGWSERSTHGSETSEAWRSWTWRSRAWTRRRNRSTGRWLSPTLRDRTTTASSTVARSSSSSRRWQSPSPQAMPSCSPSSTATWQAPTSTWRASKRASPGHAARSRWASV